MNSLKPPDITDAFFPSHHFNIHLNWCYHIYITRKEDISHVSYTKNRTYQGWGEIKENDNISTFTILLHKTPPYFSAVSSLNYEMLSEMFFKCSFHRVLGYSEFLHWSFLRQSERSTTVFFLFLNQTYFFKNREMFCIFSTIKLWKNFKK